MKVTIKGILKESYLQTHIKYLKGVAQRMKHPFMKELNSYGVDKSDWELVLSYKLGTNVSIQVREDTMVVSDRVHKVTIYDEYVSPYNDRFWSSAYYDEDGRQIYGIDSNGVVMDRTIEPPYYRD